jgi:FtsP/CotA-like multicopper oxidase with cupredoxin domain/uncharacterized protein involved in copper resistance
MDEVSKRWRQWQLKIVIASGFSFFITFNAVAEVVSVNLSVGYKEINFAGKTVQALAINNQIPAPTLHFKQGDTVNLYVYNHLNEKTAIHWHGLIVPWQMDGVEGITQQGISPGGMFHYQFVLHQSGTYWYHAHAGFQEQQGLYGAFIIDPRKPSPYHYTKDEAVVLSDWSNTCPNKIFANLKKDGDFYSPKFPLQPSLVKFIHDYRNSTPAQRKQLIENYIMMQSMRMSIYDLSDVAYDAFLLNGRSRSNPWTAVVKVGDVVRLRFIGAAGSTIYRIKIPGTSMQIVQVQGNDVKPYSVKDFTLAPGETYDVLVKIAKNSPYIIYAESADTLGSAVGILLTYPNESVNYQSVTPFPEPSPVTMMSYDMLMSGMDHNAMTMNTKYQQLMAVVPTNDPHKPVSQIIHMRLSGYMDRYLWFINGKSESDVGPIIIQPGKRYRIIFTNDSMMNHPMHIHGHWFILRNGHGAYDPLLHTIDVAPGATVVVDVDADASGQWFFHCHHLYHMMSGMARVFQYATIIDASKKMVQPEPDVPEQLFVNRPIVRADAVMPIDPSLIHHPMGHPAGLYFANFIDIGEDPFASNQQFSFKGLYGGDYNKLELFSDDGEINKGSIENANADIFYWHLISQFWAIKGGANYTYRPAGTPYWQPGVGIEGLMPYFIDTNMRVYYHDGSAIADIELSRDSQITDNFFIRTGFRSIFATQTVLTDEIGSGVNQLSYTIRPYYRLLPGLNIYTEFEHTQDFGALKSIVQKATQSPTDNIFSVGFSLMF